MFPGPARKRLLLWQKGARSSEAILGLSKTIFLREGGRCKYVCVYVNYLSVSDREAAPPVACQFDRAPCMYATVIVAQFHESERYCLRYRIYSFYVRCSHLLHSQVPPTRQIKMNCNKFLSVIFDQKQNLKTVQAPSKTYELTKKNVQIVAT